MDDLLKRLPPRPQPLWLRLVAASAIICLCIAVQVTIVWLSQLPGLFVLVAGIFACAVAYDRIAGIYASVLATVAASLAIARLYPQAPAALSIAAFFVVALGISYFGDALRSSLERTRASERDREVMFREFAHRMQNNLATAISLLDRQARWQSNVEVRAALARAVERLHVVAEGQRHLQPLAPDKVEMRGYLAQMCDHLAGSLGAGRGIEFVFRLEPIAIDHGRALALALIVNELVTNALKYAFADRGRGVITIWLTRRADGIELTVSDDGIGYLDSAPEGFGNRLVRELAGQYGGTALRIGGPPGCRTQITIPGGAG